MWSFNSSVFLRLTTSVVVKNWIKDHYCSYIVEEASSKDDIRQIFKMEEALLKLDSKLEDFTNTTIEISNYHEVVHDKCSAYP